MSVSLGKEIDQFCPIFLSDIGIVIKAIKLELMVSFYARKCLQFLIRTFSAFHSDDTRADRPALMQCPPLLYCISLYEPYCCYQLNNTHTIMELQAAFEKVKNHFFRTFHVFKGYLAYQVQIGMGLKYF